MKKKFFSLVLFALLGLFFQPLFAQEEGQTNQSKDPMAGQKYGYSKKFPLSKPTTSTAKYAVFSKVTAGMTAKDGFISLYQKEEKLYGLVKFSQLKKLFFLATSITKGKYAGMQWENMLVYWSKFNNKLLLMRPDLRYKAGKTTLKTIVSKTHPATIIRGLPILSKGTAGYLIDLGTLLKSNLSGVSRVVPFLLGVRGRLNHSLSRWNKIKAFPHNVEISVDLGFTGTKVKGSSPNWTDSADASRTHFIGVHYSISYLPRSNYRARVADDRVGYFHTAIKDFSRGYNSKTRFRRYIHRWNLQKADPKLKVSPPKKPIVFYLEKTVPYQFRRYVREGILEWNKAFEKIGFVNAMEVRQQTDTEFANLDPADVRYNFFRWVTNEMGFAAGPSRVNPLTGEIIDADIIFDDSMVRYVSGSYNRMGPASSLWERDKKFMSMINQMAGWDFSKQKLFFPGAKLSPQERNFQKLLKIMAKKGQSICMFSQGMKHQLTIASLAFQRKGLKGVPLKFLGQYIKDIVMHEVGHTLGLYHNFKASSWLSLAKINSKDKPGAITASVMDYNPINFTPKGVPQGNFCCQTIGPYDYWAIEYGYRPYSGATMLAKILRQSARPDHVYGNDMFASLSDPDPLWIRWDLGNDPIQYAKLRIALGKELLKGLLKRAVKPGENYYGVRRGFGSILGDYNYSLMLASRYIGGISIHRSHKGDVGAKAPLVVVPAKKQREALQLLSQTVFSEKAFTFDPKILQHLAPGIRWHWDSDELSPTPTYPLQQVYLRIQSTVLGILLNPKTLWRLQNSALQVDKSQDVFSIDELFKGLTGAIWSELDHKTTGKEKWSNRNPFISATRRNLQRFYLRIWLQYFVLDRGKSFIPEDAKNLARQNLKALVGELRTALGTKNLDGASKAHLSEALSRLEKALKANYIR